MNYQRLKAEMLAYKVTQEKMAKKLGISTQAMNAKLNGRSEFTVKEARIITEILHLEDPASIFFTTAVPNTQQ